MRSRNVVDARQKLDLFKAAKVVAARVAESGATGQSDFRSSTRRPIIGNRQQTPGGGRGGGGFRSGGIKQRLGTPSVIDARSRISKKVSNVRSPISPRSFSNRARIGGKVLENFKIIAQNEPNGRNRIQRMVSDGETESLTRTIRNDQAIRIRSSSSSSSTFRNPTASSLQMDRSPRILTNKKGGSVFLAALQEIEKSREESNEVLIKSYDSSSIFDRLAPAGSSKSANSSRSSTQAGGYRVILTNLNPAVSEEDVQDLFSTIGPLITSGLKRPGIGYANFARLQDAKRAVSEYNNRELDGVPMKCVLENDVVPDKRSQASSSPIPTMPKPVSNKPAVFHKSHVTTSADDDESMEVDKDLITQALFSNSSSSNIDDGSSNGSGSKHQSSAVQFTVKI